LDMVCVWGGGESPHELFASNLDPPDLGLPSS
jgi:hypothetical protein